ncbi:MAG: hypothetical protein CMO01_01440 [Thalassobius sp.]|nr:hypothetical protein [Thalassovita sp.]
MTSIDKFFQEYINIDNFHELEYGRDIEVLRTFKKEYPIINYDLQKQLIDCLNTKHKQEFVGDLMYYYDQIPDMLINKLLIVAINYKDPSFNRIFINPSIKAIGTKKIIDKLVILFKTADKKTKIGISKLFYWINPLDKKELDEIHELVLKRIIEKNDIVENYFFYYDFIRDNKYYSDSNYKLYNSAKQHLKDIPEGVLNLIKKIQYDESQRNFLKNELGWDIIL